MRLTTRNTETAGTGVEGNIPFVIGVVAAAAEDGKPDRCRRVYLRPPGDGHRICVECLLTDNWASIAPTLVAEHQSRC